MTTATRPDLDPGTLSEADETVRLIASYRGMRRAERRRIARRASPELRTVLAQVEFEMALHRSPGSMAVTLTGGLEMQAPHLALIDQLFQRMARGESIKALITMPPRHGKSQRAARWAPLWYLSKHPNHRVMIASYGADLAVEHSRWIRDAINAYGPQIGIALHAGSKAAHRFDLADPVTGDRRKGGLVAAGVGGGLTGKGADLCIVDDPIKDAADAESPTLRRNLWSWWTSVINTRLEPGGSILVIQCIVASMRVLRGDGRWVPIVDMKPGDTVVSLTPGHTALTTSKVIGQRLSGHDETLTVKTDRLALQVNPRHPFAVLRRGTEVRPDATDLHWIRAHDLKVGDLVVTAKSMPDDYAPVDQLPDGTDVDEQRAWLLGYMTGDGWVTKHKRVNQQGQPHSYAVCIARTRSKKEHKADTDTRAREALEAWSTSRVYEASGGYWRTDWAAGGRLLHEMGFGKGAQGKRVPDCVWGWSPALRRAYLMGYAEADGSLQYIGTKRASAPTWRVGSVNQALLEDVRDLSLTCGVRPTTVFVDKPRMYQPPNSPKPIESVLCTIGLSFGPDMAEGRSLLRSAHPNAQQLRYERIRSIEPGPTLPVYDLAVDGTENFVAEGFVVHNTRWHEQDLAGRLLEGQDADDWIKLDLPAICDSEDDPLGRPIGAALWPARFGRRTLAKFRRAVGERVWWSLYQQKPRPLEGGVWQWPWITDNRLTPMQFRGVDLSRIVVAVDHAGGSDDVNDETGLVAAGRTTDGHMYVVADESGRMGADTWGHKACRLALKVDADAIVVEANFGGDMAKQIIVQAWKELAEKGETKGRLMPAIIEVHAKQGKRLRAEPIAQLYSQGLAHHVGEHPRLEGQLVTWIPGMDSPDRMDALVHALTELADPAAVSTGSGSYEDRRLAGRR